MSPKLSVEEVLVNLEQRAVALREQTDLHAQKAAYHQAQQSLLAAELEKVLHSLESFRAVAGAAMELAQPLTATTETKQEAAIELPPPGRLQISRLIRLVAEHCGLAEPFGASAVAAEANRRFADRLREPIDQRTASDVLRRMHGEGWLRVAQKGKAFHEALYTLVRG
jgi:hypothetical protein